MELWITEVVAPLGLTIVLRPFAIAALLFVFGVFTFLVWCALREAYMPSAPRRSRRATDRVVPIRDAPVPEVEAEARRRSTPEPNAA